jgi:hypothetical protein
MRTRFVIGKNGDANVIMSSAHTVPSYVGSNPTRRAFLLVNLLIIGAWRDNPRLLGAI